MTAPQLAPADLSGSSLCPQHQEPARATCPRCGTFTCTRCGPVEGLCPACVARLADATPYFAVSLPKLVVLSILTFGLYEIYWFYQNWKRVRARDEDVSPVLRTLFSGLFCFSLFRRIADSVDREGVPRTFHPTAMGAAFLGLTLCSRLPDPLWLITLAGVAPLLPVQAAVNALNARLAPGADPNARFTPANIVLVVVGALCLVLALIGTTLPEEA